MRAATSLPLLAVLLTACGESSAGIECSCIAALNVDGVTFTGGGRPSIPPEEVGDIYMEVTRYTDCQDEGCVRPIPWEHGVSNFLPVGTRIHQVTGIAPTERLTHWSDVVDEWLPLVPLRHD